MSSGSESDEDYVPGEPEQVSEEGSADEETDLQYEQELEHKSKKRKANKQVNEGKRKKVKTRKANKETVTEEDVNVEVLKEVIDPEEQKKREEDLWAKFLDGTDTKPKSTSKQITSIASQPAKTNTNNTDINEKKPKDYKESKDDEKARERRIFEFAGETIVVENNVIKEKIKTPEVPTTASKLDGPSSHNRPSGGLSGLLNNLNKTSKLSTLEKSKLDWLTFKKEEGIEEEIESHNKGKAGYLDRQDFLERADIRQYEIERDLRMSRRSNR